MDWPPGKRKADRFFREVVVIGSSAVAHVDVRNGNV